jgi:NitT/TauT family transport system permease protein
MAETTVRDRRSRLLSAGVVIACQIAVLIVVFGIWEWLVAGGVVKDHFLSRPSQIWAAFLEFWQSGELWVHSRATLWATLWALVIGVPLGVLIGLLLSWNRHVDRVLSPFLVPLNSMPRIALAPLFIVWFGLTMTSKVVLGVSIVLFVMAFNTRAGLQSTDPNLTTMARLHGFGRRSIYWKIVLPSSVPMIFAGVRLSVTYALLGVVASEMIASRDGLGMYIVSFSNTMNIAGVFALLGVLAVMGSVLAALSDRVERWLLRWQ